MAGFTNRALLVTVVGSALLGLGSLALGTAAGAPVVLAHALLGFAVMVLTPSKVRIVNRGLKRSRAGRSESLLLATVTVVVLASGIAHSWFAVSSLGPLTMMQIHIGGAVVAIGLLVSHFRRRPQPSLDTGRRTLVRALGIVGGAAMVTAAAETALTWFSLPGADRRFTGSHEVGSFVPAAMPAVQWFLDTAPSIDPTAFSVRVAALDRVSLTPLATIKEGRSEVEATLDCTSGWFSTQVWTGVSLGALLDGEVGPAWRAEESIEVVSATGYTRRFPIRDADDLLLAHSVGNEQLSSRHGAPLRLVAPGRRGFWWVKWVAEVRVDRRPWWVQSPFPLD